MVLWFYSVIAIHGLHQSLSIPTCFTAVGKVFSFHQREQKWEMCYILASPSTALSHFNCAWCISKRKQTNKWHWAVLEVIVGTIWTNYISWWATQCNTKNRVTGNKKQTPKTTPTPQLDGRAAILFQTHLPPFIFTPSPPPCRLPAHPARPVLPPGRHRTGLTGAVGGRRHRSDPQRPAATWRPPRRYRRDGPPGGARGAAGERRRPQGGGRKFGGSHLLRLRPGFGGRSRGDGGSVLRAPGGGRA